MRTSLALPLALLLAVAACDGDPDPTAVAYPQPLFAAGGVLGFTSGGGHFDAGVDVQFAFTALQTDADGTGAGNARHSAVLGGLLIEFHTRVTCVTFDAANNRAWIAGVITRNASEHPSFTGAIHQVGRDIWFRVVDYGEGRVAPQPDRSTFVGFEGSAGIITSAEYCAARLWPDNDERTSPVTAGNLQVQVR